MVILRTLASALVANVLLASIAWAAVVASVDRPNVDLNESFTLEVSVDVVTDEEPDFSVLEDDFYVGQVSKLSSTSIVNGQMTRSMTWSVSLMPKRTGTIQIPPIAVGAERSNGVPIVVNEAAYAPPGEADVFVTSDVDVDETWVQAQILYRIRIYRAVPTRQPALREPTISGAETLTCSRRAYCVTGASRAARCSSPTRTRSRSHLFRRRPRIDRTRRGCPQEMWRSARNGRDSSTSSRRVSP
jgi:hypothetical protein